MQNIELNAFVLQHLIKTERLIRDLAQAVALAGEDVKTLQHVIEAVEIVLDDARRG